MQNTGKLLCPFCSKELPEPTNWCWHCGKDLHGMKMASLKTQHKMDCYEIVADGHRFGIAFRKEIKIHGLDIKRAESLLAILNSVGDVEETG